VTLWENNAAKPLSLCALKGVFSNEPKPTPEEMEKYVREDVAVSDNDLRLLAQKRAEKVLNYLVNNGPVESERLFILEPKLQQDEDHKPANSGMNVKLVIK